MASPHFQDLRTLCPKSPASRRASLGHWHSGETIQPLLSEVPEDTGFMDGKQGPDAGHRTGTGLAWRSRTWPASWPVLPAPDSAGLIDEIRDLEDLKSAAAARQARHAVAFDALQRRDQAAAGSRRNSSGPGSARRSPSPGANPPPKAAGSWAWPKPSSPKCPTPSPPWKPGILNEWRATLLVRETACLTAADRTAVDEDTRARHRHPHRRRRPAPGRRRPRRRLPAGPPLRHRPRRARRQPNGTSASARPRTPWPASPRCCPSPRASPSTTP